MKPVEDKYTSEVLDKKTEIWVKSILSNDDMSSDEDLISLFMDEGNMSREEATTWVLRRNFYLNNIVSTIL